MPYGKNSVVSHAISSLSKQDKKQLKKKWKFSFSKANLKQSSSHSESDYFNANEISFLLYFIQQKKPSLFFVSTANRSPTESFKLFLQISKQRVQTGPSIGSLNDLLLLCCTPFRDADYKQFQGTPGYANYDEITKFDAFAFLNSDKTNFNDEDDDDDLLLGHSQQEIANEEGSPPQSLFNGLSYSLSSMPSSSRSNASETSPANFSQATNSLIEMITSQNTVADDDKSDENKAMELNYHNFFHAIGLERKEMKRLENNNASTEVRRSNVLSAMIANKLLFSLDLYLPIQTTLLSHIKYFAKIIDNDAAEQFVMQIEPTIKARLLHRGVINTANTIVNLSKFPLFLKGRAIPELLISKFSPTSSNSNKRGRSNPNSPLNSSSRKRPKTTTIASTTNSASVQTAFRFPDFIAPQTSVTNTNPITKSDLESFRASITESVRRQHHKLRHELDAKNYATKPPLQYNTATNNLQRLILTNKYLITAPCVDKKKKQDCVLTMVDLAISSIEDAEVSIVNKLINAKLTENGRRITGRDIVQDLEGSISSLLSIFSLCSLPLGLSVRCDLSFASLVCLD